MWDIGENRSRVLVFSGVVLLGMLPRECHFWGALLMKASFQRTRLSLVDKRFEISNLDLVQDLIEINDSMNLIDYGHICIIIAHLSIIVYFY